MKAATQKQLTDEEWLRDLFGYEAKHPVAALAETASCNVAKQRQLDRFGKQGVNSTTKRCRSKARRPRTSAPCAARTSAQ
jgi:hypothetical protein